MSLGPLELGILLLIALLIFGPKRLPGLGRQLGSGMREFKEGITGKRDDDDASEPERATAIESAPAAAPPAAAPPAAAPAAPEPVAAEGADAPGAAPSDS